jgi:hypothetical protein
VRRFIVKIFIMKKVKILWRVRKVRRVERVGRRVAVRRVVVRKVKVRRVAARKVGVRKVDEVKKGAGKLARVLVLVENRRQST